jgi:hypothetical protein
MTTHPLWRPFQLIDPVEVDSRLLMPRRGGEITMVSPDPGWPPSNGSERSSSVHLAQVRWRSSTSAQLRYLVFGPSRSSMSSLSRFRARFPAARCRTP